MGFPAYRPRCMRANPAVRAFVRETRVEPGDLVYPVFVKPGAGVRDEVASMPGVFQLSIDQLAAEVDELRSCRVNSLMLFGLPARKDERGSEAYDDRGVVQQAVRAIKEHAPDFHVITDVCLCEYTSHGHCGVLDERGGVDNDETLGLLAAEAVSHARAGADMVAPSDMMDGRVGALRSALDEAGFSHVTSWRMRRSTRRATTGRSAMRPIRRRRSATARRTRWIPRTASRRCARCASTSRRGPTLSS